MAFKTDELVGAAIKAAMESQGGGRKTNAPALIGMSLRQDIPGGFIKKHRTTRCPQLPCLKT
jgi:hypothetical protein